MYIPLSLQRREPLYLYIPVLQTDKYYIFFFCRFENLRLLNGKRSLPKVFADQKSRNTIYCLRSNDSFRFRKLNRPFGVVNKH